MPRLRFRTTAIRLGVLAATAAFAATWVIALRGGERRTQETRASGAAAAIDVDVTSGGVASSRLPALRSGTLYGTLVFVPRLRDLAENDLLVVSVSDAQGVVARKALHAGDPDFYLTMQPRADGDGRVEIHARRAAPDVAPRSFALRVACAAIPVEAGSRAQIAPLSGAAWRDARPIELGRTVHASNDERPYVPLLGDPIATLAQLTAGVQWFTFRHAGPEPTLVHFIVDVLDRDVPMDVRVFARRGEGDDAQLELYERGAERYVSEQTTRLHGLNKFLPRVIEPGTYFVRVMGNHPSYQLRTELSPVPPFDDPAKAIRVGMDYLIRRGDSWQADLPRRGAVALRTASKLGETAQCVGCHATQFTTRAQAVGIENGWPLRERHGTQFLIERLYNNPRPMYGDSSSDWARMIGAPGNVLSRLACIVMRFEEDVSGERRDGVVEPIARYLEKYWKDVRSPITESNGNQPLISGFEIALHSATLFGELARRGGDARYAKVRESIEAVIVDGAPVDMIDLCWKLVALCELDHAKHASRIDGLVKELWSRQRADGTWAVAFDVQVEGAESKVSEIPRGADGLPKSSDFQTYHAIYALAKAGATMDDPRIAAAVRACMARQWPHGGWQGEPDYKNFDTVFRDSQFAVMALAQVIRGPGAKGWSAGLAPQPKELPRRDAGALLAALDEIWTDPGPSTRAALRELLAHEQPLVREAAAAAIGRTADADSVAPLVKALGDGSKLVQRSAAWALRQVAARRGAGVAELAAALRSPDDRTRSGAVRVFNQHFRGLVPHWPLGDALLEQVANDPVPANRMQAAQALAQWWTWERSEEHRAAIEDRFIERLAAAEHPWVRRSLIEGLHNVLDDNVRYLLDNYIGAFHDAGDAQRAMDSHRAVAMRQARKLAAAIERGDPHQRDGVMRAFYAFHLREGDVDFGSLAEVEAPKSMRLDLEPRPGAREWIDGYKFAAAFDPITMGTGSFSRVGNDAEAIYFHPDSGAVMESALEHELDAGSVDRATSALKVLRASRGIQIDGALAAKALALAATPAFAHAREALDLMRDVLLEKLAPSKEVAGAMADLLSTGRGEALRMAVALLGGPRLAELAGDPAVSAALKRRLQHAVADDADLESLLGALIHATALHGDADVQRLVVLRARDGSERIRARAFDVLLRAERMLLDKTTREDFESDVVAADAARLRQLLIAATSIDWSDSTADSSKEIVLGIVTTAMQSDDAGVRRAAVDAVGAIPFLQANPAVTHALTDAAGASGVEIHDAAASVLKSIAATDAAGGHGAAALPDFETFVANVQPIFQRPGADGDACMDCHASHSILKLAIPADGGRLSPAELRQNYFSALKVVDLRNPENSLILVKPRSPFEGNGVPGNYRRTHGGDVRWPSGKEGEDYRRILQWIQGARVAKPAPPR